MSNLNQSVNRDFDSKFTITTATAKSCAFQKDCSAAAFIAVALRVVFQVQIQTTFSSVWWWIQERLGLMCKTFHDAGCRALIIHLLFRFPLQKGTEPEIAQFPISLRRRRRRNGKDSLSFPEREGLKWGPPSLAWPPTSRDPWIHNNEQMKQSFERHDTTVGGKVTWQTFQPNQPLWQNVRKEIYVLHK